MAVDPLLGAHYGLIDVPTNAINERSMQSRCLLRYIFLQKSESALKYYVDIALDHLTKEVKGIERSLLAVLLQQKQKSVVHRQLFVILVVLNATTSFYQWIRQFSQDEHEIVTQFVDVLQSHFNSFLSKTKEDGTPASNPEDVVYPTLDHFVNTLVGFYIRQ